MTSILFIYFSSSMFSFIFFTEVRMVRYNVLYICLVKRLIPCLMKAGLVLSLHILILALLLWLSLIASSVEGLLSLLSCSLWKPCWYTLTFDTNENGGKNITCNVHDIYIIYAVILSEKYRNFVFVVSCTKFVIFMLNPLNKNEIPGVNSCLASLFCSFPNLNLT